LKSHQHSHCLRQPMQQRITQHLHHSNHSCHPILTHIQFIPPPPYATPSSCQHNTHGSPSHANTSATRPTPSLEDFLQELDREYGKDGEYTQFLQSFQTEALRVPHIKYLTVEQFREMGVTRIGWQITLKKESEKYKQ